MGTKEVLTVVGYKGRKSKNGSRIKVLKMVNVPVTPDLDDFFGPVDHVARSYEVNRDN